MATATILPESLQIELDDAITAAKKAVNIAKTVIARGCTTEEAHQLHLKVTDCHQFLQGLHIASFIYQNHKGNDTPELLQIEISDEEASIREAQQALIDAKTPEAIRNAQISLVGTRQYVEGLKIVKGIYETLQPKPALNVVPTKAKVVEFAQAA